MRSGSWGIVCVKLLETVAVIIGGVGSEWVVVGLPEEILSFLIRGTFLYIYSESVSKSIYYLVVTRIWEEI